ncbi:MAG TPA: glycosyltransferase family 4 protein [Oligoflexia bacterium]|nr:glycosyltransferase family 4 protein [Oligoflexia bacterium]
MSKNRIGKLGFVIPRADFKIVGGAEQLTLQLAQKLEERNPGSIEIFTTCALDHRSWENQLPAGQTFENGLIINRFPVDNLNRELWATSEIKMSNGATLSVDEQLDWLANGVISSTLISKLLARGPEFDFFIFAPYLFGTTFFGVHALKDKALLIPCLHDERYAYLEVMGTMFRAARGAIFNASAEIDLARRLYGPILGGEVGLGFELYETKYLANLTPYFEKPFPYVIYAGRKETGKNVHLLIDYFIAAKERGLLPSDLKLVLVGGGSIDDLGRASAVKRDDIIDLGYLSEIDKQRAIKHALVLCQPSVNESFSIVLMEAWRLAVPVIVNGKCQVTRDHAVESGGGLYFYNLDDFAGAVNQLAEDQAFAKLLAKNGANYLVKKYSWDSVLRRFDAVLDIIKSEIKDGRRSER